MSNLLQLLLLTVLLLARTSDQRDKPTPPRTPLFSEANKKNAHENIGERQLNNAHKLFAAGKAKAALEAGRKAQAGYHAAGNFEYEVWTLESLAWRMQVSGDHEEALLLAEEAIKVAQQISDDKKPLAHSLAWSGWILGEMGRCGSALLVLEQARQLSKEIDFSYGYGLATQDSADCYRRLGKYDKAEALLLESIEIARNLNVKIGIVEGNTMLADVRMHQRDFDGAERLLQEARNAADPHDPMQLSYVEDAFGRLALERHDSPSAQQHFQVAYDHAAKHEFKRGQAMALLGLARVNPDPAKAYEEIERALEISANIHDEHEGPIMLHAGARLADLGKLDKSDFVLDQALELVRELFQRERQALVKSEQGYVASLRGDERLAIERLKEALIAFEESGDTENIWFTNKKIADAYDRLGQSELAIEYLEKALAKLAKAPIRGAPKLQADRDRARLQMVDRLLFLYAQRPMIERTNPAPI